MKKKISIIIAYSLLAVVVIGLIVCSILKINYMPEMNIPTTETIGKIQISATDGTSRVESNNQNINIEEFNKIFNNSFKLTVLYSIFSGRINKDIVRGKNTSLPAYSGFKVEFIYNEIQTLKKDGKEIPVADNSTTPITYNRVEFDVAGGNGLTEVNLYFYINGESNYQKITTIANFDKLYEHISQISMFGE